MLRRLFSKKQKPGQATPVPQGFKGINYVAPENNPPEPGIHGASLKQAREAELASDDADSLSGDPVTDPPDYKGQQPTEAPIQYQYKESESEPVEDSPRDTANDMVKVFKDSSGEFRWHRKAGNNEIISDSGEGYKKLSDAMTMAKELNPGIEPEYTLEP